MITIERPMNPNALRQVETLPVMLFEGESYAHKFVIRPTDGVSFDGYSVTGRFVHANQTQTDIVAPGGWLDNAGNACVVLTPSCYSISGKYSFFIYVANQNETVCVYSCTGTVVPTVGANGSAGTPVTPIIETYENGDNFMPVLVPNRESSMVATTHYQEGDILSVGLNLYKVTAPIFEGDALSTTSPSNISEITMREYLNGSGMAEGNLAHAEGHLSLASGRYSHAEGFSAVASGESSHAEGRQTIANHRSQHVFGEYNVSDGNSSNSTSRGTYVEIVGNGTSAGGRQNARTLDWMGNETLAGSLTLGQGSQNAVTIHPSKMAEIIALSNLLQKLDHQNDDRSDLVLDSFESIIMQYLIESENKSFSATVNIYHLWLVIYAKQLLEACRINGLNIYQVMDRIVNMAEAWTGGSFGDGSGSYGTDHGVTIPDFQLLTPVINSHPSDKQVNAGALVVFNADIDNATSYQWQYSQDSGTTWTDCGSGFTGPKTIRVLFQTTAAMNGWKFRLVASNERGSVTTNPATLTVVSSS